ncbi:MAG TPA: hypothetical protein VJY35_10540 [Candidatus Eisenbacteria bacterium]|nr:hypothetical protein [Candidatus Eisenbacteria bacterium]
MAYISAVAKGDRFAAGRAAADRGIPAAFVREVPSVGGSVETVFATSPEHVSALAAWLAEPSTLTPGIGFPVGTLLIYSHHDDAEAM